jgi:sortase A
MKTLIKVAQYGFITTGILALGYWLTSYLEQKHFQSTESRRFRENLHPQSAVPQRTIQNGAVLGRIEIPRIGLAVMVVEGVEESELKRAAGRIQGTALPGQAGNIGIAAHRDTFFRPLRRVRQGDLLMLSTRQSVYRYRVVSTYVVSPAAVQVLYPTANDSLTLVTCFPFDYIGPAPKRFIVRAGRVQD